MEREAKGDGAEIIRKLIRAGKYEFSIHAEKERQADKITMVELEKALGVVRLSRIIQLIRAEQVAWF
jgi:hypothetical protein